MAGSIYSWSVTAGNNATADGDINWNEGQAPYTVNNSARQMMARLAEYLLDQGGSVASVGADTITATVTSAVTAYATGQSYMLKAGSTNTTNAVTLNINGIGAKAVRKFTTAGEVPLQSGDITAGGHYFFQYDAALNSGAGAFILVDPALPAGLMPVGRQSTSLASAATVDLSTATGWYVNITVGGVTTITSLGTVPAGTPYILTFSAGITITHNATSLILPTASNITTAAGDSGIFISNGSGNWRCISFTLASGAILVSPALTGTPTAPTAAVNTNTTQIATTAFVLAQAGAASPLMDGTATVGTTTKFAREDHIHPSDTSRVAKAGDTMTGTLQTSYGTATTLTTHIFLKPTDFAVGKPGFSILKNSPATEWNINLWDGSSSAGTISFTTTYLQFNAQINATGQLSIGNAGNAIGNLANGKSLAIGDSDTGLRQNGDGILEVFANDTRVEQHTNAGTTRYNPLYLGDNAYNNIGVYFNGATSTSRYQRYQTAGSTRWDFGVSADPETGANAGSDIFLNRFSDAGAYLGTPLNIRRSDGRVSIVGDISLGGAINTSGGATFLNDGNIYMAWAGSYLSSALASKLDLTGLLALSYNNVGGFAFMLSPAAKLPGDTSSGVNLNYSDANNLSGATATGTWRHHGKCSAGVATLCQRIS